MRRVVVLCLVICLLMTASACYVYGAIEPGYSTMSANYNSASADLSINDGTAFVSGSLVGVRGTTTKATVHLYLQQYRNGEWINYGDWLESNDGRNCIVSRTISVPKGYTYRAKASCYAYAGSNSEHVMKYSSEVKY